MKQGILGGTFDPVHNGHLAIAKEVRQYLDLDEVLFVPAGQPWRKAGHPISSVEHRVEMVRLAIAGESFYRLCLIEVEREGASYTLDTLIEMEAYLGEGDELYFIVGWDNLTDLPNWREPERILQLCCLVAVPRPGCSRPDITLLENAIPGISARVVLLDGPVVDISATGIRDMVSRGLNIGGFVPAAVENYIREHGLYTEKEDS